ncbi:hypothetical protein V7S43_015681 [Phytophthora oleae]|uniref:Uncharacterized protein n=1 Tax=Phytophthora oleae TaxID=2107226 RepID=A0ABD3F209_9STRA
MKVNKFFQFAIVLFSAPSICHAWSVRIQSGGKLTDPSKKFSFSTAQRCYSLSCWDNKSRAAKWSDLPSDARIIFYASTECQGRYAVGEKKSSGEIDFVPEHLSGDVSSFMVWQSGIYATAGFADLCEENALVLTSDQLKLLRARQESLNSSSDGKIKKSFEEKVATRREDNPN